MNKWLFAAIIALGSTCANAQTTINHFTPGGGPSPGLISTTNLNKMVDQVNGLTGNGTAGNVKLGNGTVALPSLAFGSDTDTGIYRIGANNIGIAANAAKVLDIATTGLGITGLATITSASATALSVGRLGATTPALLVDASTATSITGIKIKSAGTGAGIAISAIGEASNGNLTIDAQGSGTISLGATSTGRIVAASQLTTTFGTPTITSGACGTTTNGVITSGTNQAGLVTIGAAATTTCTINFSTTITAPNACVVFPHDAGGAATGTTVARVSSVSTTNFVISGSALASTSYYYLCI